MRIAINTRFLLKGSLEGIGRYTWEIASRMAQSHPEDQFFFFFDRPYDASFIVAPNITPVVLFPPARHPFLFVWWYEWAVANALKQYQIDVFFSPDNFLSLRTKVPSVLVVHDLAYLHYPDHVSGLILRYYRYFMPRFIAKASHIIAVSEYTRQDIFRFFKKNENDISIGYNGCRAAFQPIIENEKQTVRDQFSAGKPYFIYIGAVHPRKNIHRLITAFDQFKKNTASDYLLLIAGRFAWQTGPVKTAYDNATHREDIRFLGYVPDEELPRLTAAAAALINVSLFEGFGVPVLEALYCDVPVLVSDRASLPEIAGAAGLQVNPESTDEIAAAMERLSQDAGLREQLIEAGREQRRKFSWYETAERIYRSLYDLCFYMV